MVAGIALEPEWPLRKIDLHDVVHHDLGADMLGLLAHLLHEPRPLDHVGETGIVFDIGGDRQLTAGLVALDHDRGQHGAGGIDRSRIAGRAGPEDDDACVFGVAHDDPSVRRAALRCRR